ncbi:MAG: chromosome segregation protein SMC [Rhodobiaceae bacterium]
MKFDRLRLSGFKSFVDPVDLDILPGITGIVGPNGCGKSNLLEALRWVMGETSYKSMRGAGMEDVIFSGTNARPSRNHAEVQLFLDNSARGAPAEYNDSDQLEVVRRIEREAGSAYRVNGRDVRARDVQLLFADASSGARSNALVKQGQIGEIINAKPEARRRILEEAAGISGLHSRRHEAELRLRGAESNLEKLDDTLSGFETQYRQLKRQARQASRYRNISGQIREVEALALHLRWQEAEAKLAETETALIEARQSVAQAGSAAMQASTQQSELQAKLPELRMAETEKAAALRRIKLEQDGLEAEARRAQEMAMRLAEQLATIEQDMARGREALADAGQQQERLKAEEAELRAGIAADESAAENAAAAEVAANVEKLQAAEAVLDASTRALAEYSAQKQALQAGVEANQARREKLQAEQAKLAETRSAIEDEIAADFDLAARRSALSEAETLHSDAESALQAAAAALEAAIKAHDATLEPAREAQARLERLAGERDALQAMVLQNHDENHAPIVDSITVEAGYEVALGAALGDDLEVAANDKAAAHWGALGENGADAPLPDNVASLAQFVSGAPRLTRRLSQIGLVSQADGAELQKALKPGQRLVSLEGDLWRWDGYCAAADAPVAAAQRLAQRNRLEEVLTLMPQAEQDAEKAHQAVADALAVRQAKTQTHEAGRTALAEAQNALGEARQNTAQAEAGLATQQAKLNALEQAQARIAGDLEEINAAEATARENLQLVLQDSADADALAEAVAAARAEVEQCRAMLSEAQATLQNLQSQRKARDSRLSRIAEDLAQWQTRFDTATAQLQNLAARQETVTQEKADMEAVPDQLADRRGQLADLVAAAETERQQAADSLAEAENALSVADADMRATQARHGEARELQARLEATKEGDAQRVGETAQRIREALQAEPEQALAISAHDTDKPFPDVEAMETKLEKLRRERETLGGVNLRAEEEAVELAAQIESLTGERDELTVAINKLRHGIGQLNREGRQRLLAAFETVNGHFRRLFTQLFGGGEARLELTESDDPLQAGLEIIAHAPGKKPQLLSLLSGGEQALTAMALIFAVFLTNPSPICVLDEVDAPLDDANVERFCNLLKEIADETDTRFLLITHHALTMARVDRLFGVTMQERGVSQLLSVDLTTAEQFAETGRDKNAMRQENQIKSAG